MVAMISRETARICRLAALALAGAAGQAVTSAPDLILINGRVFTATNGPEFVEALAIRGDRIISYSNAVTNTTVQPNGTHVVTTGETRVVRRADGAGPLTAQRSVVWGLG